MTRNSLIALATIVALIWAGALFVYTPINWIWLAIGLFTGMAFVVLSVSILDSPRRK